MAEKIDFSFTKSSLMLTEEEYQEAASKSTGGGSKFCTPGVYAWKIITADFSRDKATGEIKRGKNDATWINVALEFENAAGQTLKYWLMVPTSKLTYNEANSKRPEFVFFQFRQFMAAIGVEVTADAKILGAVMKKYFSDPKKLIGKTFDAEVGYKGPYLKYLAKDQYQICKPNGDVICPDIFADRKTAEVKATEMKLQLSGFVEITNFLGKKQEPAVVEASEPEVVVDEW
jgi:hypothetical protein